jgi:hypothetical protein
MLDRISAHKILTCSGQVSSGSVLSFDVALCGVPLRTLSHHVIPLTHHDRRGPAQVPPSCYQQEGACGFH